MRELEAVHAASRRAGDSWEGDDYRLDWADFRGAEMEKLLTFSPSRRLTLRKGMSDEQRLERAGRSLLESAARRAGVSFWDELVHILVDANVREWIRELVKLARAFHLHDTDHREVREMTTHEKDDSDELVEVPLAEISVAAIGGPLTFSDVARAVVALLEQSSKERGPACYLRPFQGTDAAAALRAALPYGEPVVGPNEIFGGEGVSDEDEFGGNATPITFDAEANELISRYIHHRLAWAFHRAARVSRRKCHPQPDDIAPRGVVIRWSMLSLAMFAMSTERNTGNAFDAPLWAVFE